MGWIPPQVASLLTRYPEVFDPPQDGAVSLCHNLDTHGRRSEAVDAVLQTMRHEGSLTCLKGWRDEVLFLLFAFRYYIGQIILCLYSDRFICQWGPRQLLN